MSEAVTDPVGYFLEEMTLHGKSERTREAYGRVLRRFESFLQERGETPASAGRRECMAFVHSLREEYADSTVASYASYVHRFYGYMTQAGALDGNPMALVTEEMDESIATDPARREISVEEMRSFLGGIDHPQQRAVVLTLLKTGIRVGELCNLDLRDLSLSGWVEAAYDYTPRAALSGRGDALYVASVARGEEIDGEVRTASNKRERSTVIPVDGELRAALTRWLAVRPDSPSPARPLFTGTSRRWGQRLEPSQVRRIVRRHAEREGWYRVGGGAEENVTPHYFRHFFTTHLRDRTGDRGVVKYLRGDVARDVIDTYTHNWGDRVREVYEANIYSIV